MTRASLCVVLVLLPLCAFAADPPPPKAPPLAPEIKKTVDALAGKWSFAFTATMPGGAAPMKFVDKFDCKKVATGRGVACTDVGTIPGVGKVEFMHLVAYDPERKAVHWFAVGSTGEVHDHICHWTDDKTLDCDPLKATMEGKPITETVKVIFDAGTVRWSGSTVTTDGEIKFEGSGKRGG